MHAKDSGPAQANYVYAVVLMVLIILLSTIPKLTLLKFCAVIKLCHEYYERLHIALSTAVCVS